MATYEHSVHREAKRAKGLLYRGRVQRARAEACPAGAPSIRSANWLAARKVAPRRLMKAQAATDTTSRRQMMRAVLRCIVPALARGSPGLEDFGVYVGIAGWTGAYLERHGRKASYLWCRFVGVAPVSVWPGSVPRGGIVNNRPAIFDAPAGDDVEAPPGAVAVQWARGVRAARRSGAD